MLFSHTRLALARADVPVFETGSDEFLMNSPHTSYPPWMPTASILCSVGPGSVCAERLRNQKHSFKHSFGWQMPPESLVELGCSILSWIQAFFWPEHALPASGGA